MLVQWDYFNLLLRQIQFQEFSLKNPEKSQNQVDHSMIIMKHTFLEQELC